MTIRELMRHIKLVNKRTSRATKIAVCTAVAVSLTALLVLHSAALDAKAKADAWRERAQQLEQENDRLQAQIDNLGSGNSVEQIAKDELGLVDPDTIVIQPEN